MATLAVPGWEGMYAVTSTGRVLSLPRRYVRQARELSQFLDGGGYPCVTLTRDHATHNRRVHELVLFAFVGPRPAGYHCCHYDDDKTNNGIENLRWDTPGANVLDRVRLGTHNNANKTHCPSGHPYSPENTYTNGGRRRCRACKRARDRGQYQRTERAS